MGVALVYSYMQLSAHRNQVWCVRHGRPVSHDADWRSIHAYTSRSFHRRCFPIL